MRKNQTQSAPPPLPAAARRSKSTSIRVDVHRPARSRTYAPSSSVGVDGRITEYELGEKIGRGGFGAVYEAYQPRMDRKVAIKVLHRSATRQIESLSKRFKREIDLARRLEHPNIVRLYDYGETPSGLVWMAMELVRGEGLDDLLKRNGRLEPARAHRIMLQILSALAEAHSRNIVHRDLKPGNIMLTRSGADSDIVKLLDFGLAKAFGDREDAAIQDLTVDENMICGTPRYMAPEVPLKGRVGPHTDVYSAGLILFEMLEGHAAIAGESAFEILAHQMKDEIRLESPNLSPQLSEIIGQATKKAWQDRYPTALEFHQALLDLDSNALLPVRNRDEASQGHPPSVSPKRTGDDTVDIRPPRLLTSADIVLDSEKDDDDSDTIDATSDWIVRPPPPVPGKPGLASRLRSPRALQYGLPGLVVVIVAFSLILAGSWKGDGELLEPKTAPTEALETFASTSASATLSNAGSAAAVGATAAGTTGLHDAAPAGLNHVPDALVRWSFGSNPQGARVDLAGETLCDATPCTAMLERGEEPVEVGFTLDGHAVVHERLEPSESGMIKVVLSERDVDAARLAGDPEPVEPMDFASTRADTRRSTRMTSTSADHSPRSADSDTSTRSDASRDSQRKRAGGEQDGSEDPFNLLVD